MRMFFASTARILATAGAVFGATGAVAAPSTAGDDPGFANTGITSVPPVSGRGYNIEARVRSYYDSNILRRGDGFPDQPGRDKSDMRISPSLTASIGLPVGRQQVFLGGIVGRDFYVSNTRLDKNRYAIGGGINLRAGSSCTGTLAANLASRQILITEVAELIPSVQESLVYGGSATCQSAVGLGFGGTVLRTETRNSTIQRRGYDLNSTLISPQISYGIGNIGRFSLSGSMNMVEYPNRPVLLPGGGVVVDGVDIWSGRLGYSRELGTRWSLAVGISYVESKPDPETVVEVIGTTVPPAPPGFILGEVSRDTFSGLGYDGAITYRPNPRLTMTFNAARNVNASANVGAQYVISTRFGADADYALGQAINVGTGVTYGTREYANSFTNIGEPTARIEDKFSRVYGSVSYSPVKLYSVLVEVAYQNRKSVPVEYSFDSFSASLILRASFGRVS